MVLSSPVTTKVVRDIPSFSVLATASESMLKPRLAKSPAKRIRTPGLLRTVTLIMCLRVLHAGTKTSSGS